jgi:hypothetical protein
VTASTSESVEVRIILALVLLMVLLVAFAALTIMKYQGLESRVQEACSETGAAAKLDLSSFVPVCLEVKP